MALLSASKFMILKMSGKTTWWARGYPYWPLQALAIFRLQAILDNSATNVKTKVLDSPFHFWIHSKMEPSFAAFRIPKLLSMELGRNKSSVRHSAATEDNSFFGHLAGFDRKTEKPKNRRLWKIVISFFSGKCYSRFPSSSVRFDASPRRKKSSFESFRSGTSSGLKLGVGFSVVVMIRLGALELRFCFAAGSKLELKLLMA